MASRIDPPGIMYNFYTNEREVGWTLTEGLQKPCMLCRKIMQTRYNIKFKGLRLVASKDEKRFYEKIIQLLGNKMPNLNIFAPAKD